MATTWPVSLWDGPDSERVVEIASDDPRAAAAQAEDDNPGFEAWFVGDEITAGRCGGCRAMLLVDDDFTFDAASRRQFCVGCRPSPALATEDRT